MRLKVYVKKAKNRGYDLVILQGFRTSEEQMRIYNNRHKPEIKASSLGDMRRPPHGFFQSGRALFVLVTDAEKREGAGAWFEENATTYDFCVGYASTFMGKAIRLRYRPGEEC